MKKLLAILLATSFTVTAMVGCGDSKDDTSGSASKTGDGEKVELSFWHYFAEPDGPVFAEYVEKYNKSQDKIQVNQEYVPREELLKQYSIGVVSGELPDLAMVDNPDHASFSAMGVFEDLTEKYNAWDSAKFFEGPINSCKYNGKIYGLPQASNCLALFYDKDMLKEANVEVPTTWSELEEAAKKLTKGSTYGLAISAVNNEEGTFQFIPWLESAGSFDDLTSKGSVGALEFLSDLVDEGYMSKEIINWAQSDVEKQFSSGSAAMMVNGPWNVPAVRASAPDKNWGVAYVPKADDGEFASCLGGENFAVCKGANVDAAWDFLTWFCGKENSEEYCKAIGKFSPRSDVDGAEMYKDDEIYSVFATLMDSAKPRGPHEKWPEISNAIYTAEQEVFSGQKDADDAMKAAQKKVDDVNASLKK